MIRLQVMVLRQAEGEVFGEKVEGTYASTLGRYNFLSVPVQGQRIHLRDQKHIRDFEVVAVTHYAASDEDEMPVIQVIVTAMDERRALLAEKRPDLLDLYDMATDPVECYGEIWDVIRVLYPEGQR